MPPTPSAGPCLRAADVSCSYYPITYKGHAITFIPHPRPFRASDTRIPLSPRSLLHRPLHHSTKTNGPEVLTCNVAPANTCLSC